MKLYKLSVLLLCLFSITLSAQDTASKQLPSIYFAKVSSRIDNLNSKLDKKSEQTLNALQKIDQKIYRKLQKKDSTKAKEFLAASNGKYAALKQKLSGAGNSNPYISYIDTLTTSLKFFQNNKGLLSNVKNVDQQVDGALSKVKELEQSLANAEGIKAFVKECNQSLKDNLANLGFAKELKKINKISFYYSAQLNEYKEILKDKKKLEKKAMELLAKNKAFQDFMKKNSVLASLFRMPGSDATSGASLQGLQTRAQVNSLIQGRIAAGGPGAAAQVQANMQAAQAQLNELKDKVAKLGGGSSDIEMPDFKPNDQKTKSFFRRLELGTNIQSQKARFSFPITSDLGLSVGYRLNGKSIVGVGASYKLGLGTGWQNIELSQQGVGIRTFIDYKLKGSIFLSGGYEQNYLSQIKSIAQLRGQSGWASSGLLGLSKKYKVSKKLKGNMQLLWDFLSSSHATQPPLVFRLGYSLD